MKNRCYFTGETTDLKTIRLLDDHLATVGIVFISKSIDLDSVSVYDLHTTSLHNLLKRKKEKEDVGKLFTYCGYKIKLVGFNGKQKLIQFINGEHGWSCENRSNAIAAGAVNGESGYYWIGINERLDRYEE